MAETSRFWNGTAVGDATIAPYDASTEFADVLHAISNSLTNSNAGGIFRWNAQVAVAGVASPLTVGIGQALVHGTWYYNNALASVVIPTPAPGHSRIDRIVLRKDWTAQTVRITRLEGALDGPAPALTQAIGTTYDIPLAQASVTDAGVITVTDEREYIPIDNLSITDDMIVSISASKVTGTILWTTKLAETIIAPGGAIVDWQNINQNFRHLQIVYTARSMSFGGGLVVDALSTQFNADGGNNYDYVTWYRNGIGESWTASSPRPAIPFGVAAPADTPVGHTGSGSVILPNYRNTIFHKTLHDCSGIFAGVEIALYNFMGVWRSTSAINRITMRTEAVVGNPGRLFAEGSIFSLYGLP